MSIKMSISKRPTALGFFRSGARALRAFAIPGSAALAVMAFALPASVALAGEKPIQMKDLPPAVQKAVTAESKGATITGLSQETDNGKIFYEVELLVDGHGKKDVLIDANGTVVEIEEEVHLATLPAAVKAEVEKSIGKHKLLLLEARTKNGKSVGYEARVLVEGKKQEIKMDTDGKTLAGSSAEEDEEEDDEED